MIRFAIRLTLAGGRAAVIRLVSLAVAVAIGTGLLLVTLSGVHGVNAQSDRYAWLNAGVVATAQNAEPMWWMLRSDYFDSREIIRVDLAATGPGSAVPPALSRLPGPGEYYVSPALNVSLSTTRSSPPAWYPSSDVLPEATHATAEASILPPRSSRLLQVAVK